MVTIKVTVVEDDARVRASLVEILQRRPGFTCAGAYGSAEELLAEFAANRADVVVMDINLPGTSGVECVRRLLNLAPETQIMMLTVLSDTETIFDALSAGAVGYLSKPVRATQLISALREIFVGGAPMTSSIARKVIQSFQPNRTQASREDLSPREREVLDHLSRGYLYKEIAATMEISYSTVRTHIERIYRKLHVQSRSQAAATCFGPGLDGGKLSPPRRGTKTRSF
jgi:DNA-binding NarL/FixJ family response regulator